MSSTHLLIYLPELHLCVYVSCNAFILVLFVSIFTENARVMVLAATNRPSELDEAILRRFTQTFDIGMPDRSERAKILKVILKGENAEENIDYDYIADLCEGFSGSDILELSKQAAYFPVRELLNDEKNGKASTIHGMLMYQSTPRRVEGEERKRRGRRGREEWEQGPRPLRRSDLEKALVTCRKVKKATGESRLDSQSPRWSAQTEPDDDQVHNAILEISKLMSRIVSNQSEPQDP
ncbi:hypothetical protein B296_00043235 [Ensete ventricosum]|uniref:AAA ATPase AAA+ lid domain-containing protein n=1 Tax=Ensete ventricosum TaxID=4639 RepID=A0A426YIB8_ENSVE|nr:hypothetical protein B296_00043235 [Ensete ventricosum]